MPLYEYQCDSCSNLTEVIQKFSDAPLTTCGTCGGPLQRLVSAPALQFKGSGWYITDYAKSNGGNGSKSNGKSDSPSNGSSSSSSDNKPAASASTSSSSSSSTKSDS